MASKRVTLVPNGPPPPDNGPVSSARSYMRRQLTQNACAGCRRKRTKCDGGNPCSKCIARQEPCVYKAKATISKQRLRDEVQTLKQESSDARAVLNALLLDQHESIVHRLRAGEPVAAIAQSLATQDTKDATDEDGMDEEVDSKAGILQDMGSPSEALPAVDGPSGDTAIPPWLTPASTAAAPDLPIPHPTPRPVRRHSFGAHDLTPRPPTLGSSIWTKVTPNRTLVGHLITLFLSWEFPPFTIISEELFLRDYSNGGRQFCSPALVNAIASVATRHLEVNQQISADDAHRLGDQFFSESRRLLVQESRISNLTSIQTYALLALREMACGRESEAHELCLQAVRLLSALDFEDLEGHRDKERASYLTVRRATYAGVLSLTRAIRIITNQLSPASNALYSDLPLVSNLMGFGDHYLKSRELQQQMDVIESKMLSDSEPEAEYTLGAFIFDQTDCVYSFLCTAGQRDGQEGLDQLPVIYQRCLESYETISASFQKQGDTGPCTLFAHIYFHFSLLALFRPFIHYQMVVAGTSPRAVCAEAVQAILDVTQSYSNLFTLRRTPCFVPYTVFAAGLTRIILESESTVASSLSPGSAVGSTPDALTLDGDEEDEEEDTPMTGTSGRSSYVTEMTSTSGRSSYVTEMTSTSGRSSYVTEMTTPASSNATGNRRTSFATSSPSMTSEEGHGMTQAVLQLQEMSVGHPASAQAEWVLRDFDPRRPDNR